MGTTDRNYSSSGTTGITDRIKQDGKEKIDSTKRSAAEQIDQVAQALSRAGEELNQTQPTLANYASQMASTVHNLSSRLRDGNIEDLIDDTRQLARRNPGLFLLGGVALGFALSRFLKASGDQSQGRSYSGLTSGDYGTEDYSSSGGYSDTGRSSSSYASQDSTLDVESSSFASGTAGTRTRDDFSSPRSNGG